MVLYFYKDMAGTVLVSLNNTHLISLHAHYISCPKHNWQVYLKHNPQCKSNWVRMVEDRFVHVAATLCIVAQLVDMTT